MWTGFESHSYEGGGYLFHKKKMKKGWKNLEKTGLVHIFQIAKKVIERTTTSRKLGTSDFILE